MVRTVALCCLLLVAAGTVIAADAVPGRMEAARQAYQKGEIARSALELQAVLGELHERLGKGFAEMMPAPLTGWLAEPAEVQGLGEVGGGLSVTRAYLKSDSSMNASLILDSPAVAAAAALFTNPAAAAAQTNLRPVKVGAENALLRYDAVNKAGEITIVLNNRILLHIEGDNLTSGDILAEAARGWNFAGIRKLAGV
jgi:hypothetical protein